MRRLAALPLLLGLVVLPAEAATTYPLTLQNCGFAVTFDKAPQRDVTI